MHIVIRIAVETDDGRAVKETEVIRLDRGTASTLAEGGLGLTMPQAKTALAAMQKELVAAQAEQIVMPALVCQDCGKPRKIKETREIVYRTLFGKLQLRSPRLMAEKRRVESQVAADLQRQKDHAWLAYYSAPASCEHPVDWKAQVECGNRYIRAKKEFEKQWVAGHGADPTTGAAVVLDNGSIGGTRK